MLGNPPQEDADSLAALIRTRTGLQDAVPRQLLIGWDVFAWSWRDRRREGSGRRAYMDVFTACRDDSLRILEETLIDWPSWPEIRRNRGLFSGWAVSRFSPLPYFAVVMGLTGLSIAWHTAGQVFALRVAVSGALAAPASIAFAVVAVVYLAKVVRLRNASCRL